MKVNWKDVVHVATGVAGMFIPGAAAIEQAAENIATAKTGQEKAEQSITAALATLNTYAALGGKNYATPRVQAVLHRLNDDSVELLNALAEAHANS